MADDPATNDPDPDPIETELIAYLDGELDAEAASRVEAKIAADPTLRERAAALKRTFDLLDYLPTPEPARNFTTRTLDKLPALLASPGPQRTGGTPIPAPAAVSPSSSVPVVLASSPSHPAAHSSSPMGERAASPVHPQRRWVWALAVVFGVGLALGIGYVGAAVARTYLFPQSREATAEELLAERRVIENLPLYAVADDMTFVEQLASSDYFGDHPAVSFEGPKPPVLDKPTGQHFDLLARAFRSLSPARQARIRQLDQQLHDPDGTPLHLFRVLEAYAVWLDRLPETDRQGIIEAASAEKRLEAIQAIRQSQWVANLPQPQRKHLESLPPADRRNVIALWKTDEENRQQMWLTARAFAEMQRTGRKPWPFENESLRREVLEFVKVNYQPNDAKRSRLEPSDRTRLQEAVKRAEENNEWFWLGLVVADFNRPSQQLPRPDQPPSARPDPPKSARYELLPVPAVGHPITTIDDLKEYGIKHFLKGPGRARVAPYSGRWPEFAVAVADYARDSKTLPPHLRLGPCRPTEFKDDVRKAIGTLENRLTDSEWAALQQWEGKWPEYPREMIRLARLRDVYVPGAMPPGSPRKWEETYSPPRGPWPPRPGWPGGF